MRPDERDFLTQLLHGRDAAQRSDAQAEFSAYSLIDARPFGLCPDQKTCDWLRQQSALIIAYNNALVSLPAGPQQREATKVLRDAKDEFAFKLRAGHGRDEFAWPEGDLAVRLSPIAGVNGHRNDAPLQVKFFTRKENSFVAEDGEIF
jgi:hypothetical protein